MDTPSPCILRCLGDPQVIHLLWSEFRCLVRRLCSPAEIGLREKRLPTLQIYDWQSHKLTAKV